MMRKQSLFGGSLVLAALIAGLTMLLTSSTAIAQTPLEVVASGLDNPRGIAFGPDGSLYVAEAGRGGDGPCTPGPEGFSVCFGLTGAVTRVRQGNQERIATGLPSTAGEEDAETPAGSFASGPHDISLAGPGEALVIVGLGGDPAIRDTLGQGASELGYLISVPESGDWEGVVDVAAYESNANPDDSHIDSNPYGVLTQAGEHIVVDAGANALLSVGADGEISTIAVFPNRMVAAPPFLGLPPGAKIPMESVPTTVAVGPDGAYYVGELTGFPYTQGGARIFRVVPGEEPEVFAEGFTNIIDITFDSEGNLYVLEIAANSLLSEEPIGALIRVDFNDLSSRQVIASDGLTMPGSVAVGPDGNLYVSNCGVCPSTGEVVRIEP